MKVDFSVQVTLIMLVVIGVVGYALYREKQETSG